MNITKDNLTIRNTVPSDAEQLDTNVKNERAQHVYEKKLEFRHLGVREKSWCDQQGELQSSIDYELTKSGCIL